MEQRYIKKIQVPKSNLKQQHMLKLLVSFYSLLIVFSSYSQNCVTPTSRDRSVDSFITSLGGGYVNYIKERNSFYYFNYQIRTLRIYDSILFYSPMLYSDGNALTSTSFKVQDALYTPYVIFNNVSIWNGNGLANRRAMVINQTGSPTRTISGITYNGTTQLGTLQYVRANGSSATYIDVTPRLIMDTLLQASATDTFRNTTYGYAAFIADTASSLRFGTFVSNAVQARIGSTPLSAVSLLFNNTDGLASSTVNFQTKQGFFFGSIRNRLEHTTFFNDVAGTTVTNGSYNFGIARNVTANIEIQRTASLFAAGEVQFISMFRGTITNTQMQRFANLVRTFVTAKTL